MSHNKSTNPKVIAQIDNWFEEYRKKEEKAQVATTYTRSEKPRHGSNRKKYTKIKFIKKDGHVKFNTQFKVYPQDLVFGESLKLISSIPQKRIKYRDNDEISQAQDIQHAINKGYKKLMEEITIRKMSNIIAKKEEKKQKKKKLMKNQK